MGTELDLLRFGTMNVETNPEMPEGEVRLVPRSATRKVLQPTSISTPGQDERFGDWSRDAPRDAISDPGTFLTH